MKNLVDFGCVTCKMKSHQQTEAPKMNTNYDLAESLIKAIIQEHGAEGLAIAINNACAHGKAFKEAGLFLGNDDKMLNKWFEAVEIMLEVGKHIDG